MPKENELTAVNTVSDVDKIRVVTSAGLSHSIEVNKLKSSLLVDDLPDRVSELETKANTNEADHIDMSSKIEELELVVGKEEVDGDEVTNSGLFKKISGVRSDLATLHLEEVNRLDGELSGIRADLAGFKVISEIPASASAAGRLGEVCWDTSHFYVCIATNTWKRTPLESW